MSVFARSTSIWAAGMLAVCLNFIIADAQVKLIAAGQVTYFLNINSEQGTSIPYGCGAKLNNGGSSATPVEVMNCTGCHQNKGAGMTDIATSKYGGHVLFMGFTRSPGKVKSLYTNDHGQLGIGSTYDRIDNHSGNIFTDAKGIAAGDRTSFVITADNRISAFGYNLYGQLGIGTNEDELTGAYVKKYPGGEELTDITAVSAAASSTLMLDATGAVYVCGMNWNGECGLGNDVFTRNMATYLTDGVTKLASGESHNLILKNDGTVWGFGTSFLGQLGTLNSVAYTPVQIADGVSDIASGAHYSLILKGTTLYATGDNGVGQFGIGTIDTSFGFVQIATDVASMAAGNNHTVIQKTDGTFWTCGNNYYGQLGDGTYTSRNSWVQVVLPVNDIFPTSSQSYTLTNLNSLKSLQPASTDQGANVVQMPLSGTGSQLWKFVFGNGYYNIVNQSTGYYMDIYGAQTTPGANNVIWSANGGNNQKWKLIDAGNGSYNIQNLNSGLYLDISGASTADGAVDIQWTPSGGSNQDWNIAPAQSDPFPAPPKWYRLTNVNSNKVLQPNNGSTNQGEAVVQMSYSGADYQLWKFVSLGDGYYNIVNKNSGLYMDIYGAQTSPGTANINWGANGGNNQKWKLIDAGNGAYNIQNQNSGLYLDITGASTADGAADIQWPANGGANQKWYITE